MILTPVAAATLPDLLARFSDSLLEPEVACVFARIARPEDAERAAGDVAALHHRQAVELAAGFGMGLLPGAPSEGFSWDGRHLRVETEAYVLVHEVAHFQLASPSRRRMIDFGLGAGPETGERETADRLACLTGAAREVEEAMASLLGILWEVELGQPGLASFLDQNWLEGAGRPGAGAYFETVLGRLRAGGFLDAELRPARHIRNEPDPAPATS
jgi:hypothetical protein